MRYNFKWDAIFKRGNYGFGFMAIDGNFQLPYESEPRFRLPIEYTTRLYRVSNTIKNELRFNTSNINYVQNVDINRLSNLSWERKIYQPTPESVAQYYYEAKVYNKARGYDNLRCDTIDTATYSTIDDIFSSDEDKVILGDINSNKIFVVDRLNGNIDLFMEKISGASVFFEVLTPTITNITLEEAQEIQENKGVTFHYDDVIVDNNVVFTKTINTDESLKFGTAESGTFTAQISADVEQLLDKKVIPFYFDMENPENMLFLGVYKVKEDVYDGEHITHTIKAYDAIAEMLNKDLTVWYNDLFDNNISLKIPIYLLHFLSNFPEVEVDLKKLPLDDFYVKRTLTGKIDSSKLLLDFCEANAVYATINYNGELVFKSLNTDSKKIIDYYVEGTSSYEDFKTELITGVGAYSKDYLIHYVYGEVEEGDVEDNAYFFDKNYIIDDLVSRYVPNTVLEPIFLAVNAIQYRPAEVTVDWDYSIELGDRIRYTTTQGVRVDTYAFEIETAGVYGAQTTIKAQGQKKIPVVKPTPEEVATSAQEVATEAIEQTKQITDELHFSDGEELIIPNVVGVYLGMVWNNNQIRLNIPVKKLMDYIETVDAYVNDDFSLSVWYSSGTKTINTAPTNIVATPIKETNSVQLTIDYGTNAHGIPERIFAWRINNKSALTPSLLSLTFRAGTN